MDQAVFQTELDAAKWQLCFSMKKRACYFSSRTIWFEYAYYTKVVSRFMANSDGTPLVTEYWVKKDEWLIQQLKKGSR